MVGQQPRGAKEEGQSAVWEPQAMPGVCARTIDDSWTSSQTVIGHRWAPGSGESRPRWEKICIDVVFI